MIELFVVWLIDMKVPVVTSHGMKYILLAVDYGLKWVEAIALPNNKEKCVTAFFKNTIFSIFGTPMSIICDGSSDFCDELFNGLLEKYYVRHMLLLLTIIHVGK